VAEDGHMLVVEERVAGQTLDRLDRQRAWMGWWRWSGRVGRPWRRRRRPRDLGLADRLVDRRRAALALVR
jgi:hypothetical protein